MPTPTVSPRTAVVSARATGSACAVRIRAARKAAENSVRGRVNIGASGVDCTWKWLENNSLRCTMIGFWGEGRFEKANPFEVITLSAKRSQLGTVEPKYETKPIRVAPFENSGTLPNFGQGRETAEHARLDRLKAGPQADSLPHVWSPGDA